MTEFPSEGRDLTFAPRPETPGRRLSVEQIAHYNEFGYINGLDVFDRPEADTNREYFDELLRNLGDEGAYSINCYQARAQGIWDICTNPTILDYVEDLIGPDIVCWASHFFCKLPGDPTQVHWHQDASYWHLAPARTVTVWLAIDDADAGNAAMQFIPGTHRLGHLKWRKADDGPSVLDQEIENADTLGEPFVNELGAGQISLHADMLAHGSAPNDSSRRRGGLTIRYCPVEVETTQQEWSSAIEPLVCRGNDPTGRWTHHGRPVGDNVAPENAPANVGGN